MNPEPNKDVIYFARTDYRGSNKLFGIKRTDRRQHMYVVGKTGTGKSTLMENMIIQDIANGEGLAVVDPHGELVETILEKVPEYRINDVIYFNPADTEYHVGFNILELPDSKYKHLVASGLMGIFTKIWAGTWSARMEYILNNAILALLETPGSTLLGVTRILVDKDYRQKILDNVTDPVVKAFWTNEYEAWRDQFRNEAIAPIQNKVGQFLSTALIRNIVGQAKSTVNIDEIMNTGKIFLINVSKGRIGEDNSALLGAMLITKIQLAAMERVRIPFEDRVDFYLYVDEFQNFATDSFAGILSEARKYRLNLIIAHQYVGQLVTDTSTKVRDAIFGNVGTMVVFRVGAADAEFLENEFEPEFVIQDMVNLPNRCIYLKLMVDGVTSRPFSGATLPPFKVEGTAVAVSVILENSRKKYAKPRQQIEQDIKNWASGMAADVPQGSIVTQAPGGGFMTRPEVAAATAGVEGAGQSEMQQFQRPKPRFESASALAALGIEFEPRPAAAASSAPRSSTPSSHSSPSSFSSRPPAPPGGYKPGPTRPPHAGTQPSQFSSALPPRRGTTPAPSYQMRMSPPPARPSADPRHRGISRPIGAEEVEVDMLAGKEVKPMSLADLKPQEKLPKDKPVKEKVEVNVQDIQKAISEALGSLEKKKHPPEQSGH